MESPKGCSTTQASHVNPLHMVKPLPLALFHRVLAAIYTCAILAMFYHHAKTFLYSPTHLSSFVTLPFLISNLVLSFSWISSLAFRMYPVYREEFPETLEKFITRSELPGLDVFICTADPYKEPPMSVVNTALSVMAYDYPTQKISVYLSDDGGSALTLFAFMEAAKFATHWLPFCKKNNLLDRSPEAYFESNLPGSPESEKIKMTYESMKVKVEHALEVGKVDDQYINGGKGQEAFNKWTDKFTRHDHPTVIQVLLDTRKDKDINGDLMPNLIYISRQKSKISPHHFKAGALNTLVRVSSIITNAPIILTLDCDFYSNDPKTPQRALCYLCDPAIKSKLAYVQFPQHFRGINNNDIYAGAYKRLFLINMLGFDGLLGPNYVGTGCFFRRRALFGGPSTPVSPEMPELDPKHVVDNRILSQSILELSHQVASCNYENQTEWGSKIGFRYGSLVEDYYTGYRLLCEGWRSIFCNPSRSAFFGDAPINLNDMLNQQKRWSIGLLEVGLSRYSPLTYGVRHMGPLMGLGYGQLAFSPLWSIPVTTYAFIPQLALLNQHYIFPKASDPWFLLYAFLFLGSYGQDFVDFIFTGGTAQNWWNDQRFWHIRGLTCYLFGSVEYLLKSFGISGFGFNVTSKVVDEDQSKRYKQGIFEFGVHSPMFVTLTTAAIINLISFVQGLVQVFEGNNLETLFVQMFISGFVVVNCWPIYEAIILRSDNGKMPIKTTLTAIVITCAFCTTASLILR